MADSGVRPLENRTSEWLAPIYPTGPIAATAGGGCGWRAFLRMVARTRSGWSSADAETRATHAKIGADCDCYQTVMHAGSWGTLWAQHPPRVHAGCAQAWYPTTDSHSVRIGAGIPDAPRAGPSRDSMKASCDCFEPTLRRQRRIGQWDAQAVAGAFRDAWTAASTCRRVVGKIGTELSAAEISSSISVQPSTTPSTPARTRRVMTSR